VTTCEIDEAPAVLARRFFARSSHGTKISIRIGPALDTMRELTGPFNMIFIDSRLSPKVRMLS
jgi:caffeoyl-CoA O-methyltransferase